MDILIFLLGVTVLPIVINKTTERGRFDFIHPYLRETWMLLLVIFTWYVLEKPAVTELVMRHRNGWPVYIIVFLVGGGVLCLYWFATGWALRESRDAGQPTQPVNRESPPIATLREHFESGWPNLAGYYNVDTLATQGPPPTYTMQIPWRINGDFAAMSKFLEFYFEPKETPPAVVDGCIYIANNYRYFLTFPDSLIDIKAQWPSDTSVTHFRDLAFSNRVFIYYENFSLDQKARLESIYKSKGLSAQFRGAEYPVLHRYDHPPFRNKPLVANSVLVPKAGDDGMRITFTNLKEGQKIIVPLGPN